METAISTLRLLPSGKDQVKQFAAMLVSELESGMIPPLELKKLFKCLDEVAEAIKEPLNKLALEEAEKHGAKSFEALGMKITITELGTKYDFARCGDPYWALKNQEKQQAEEAMKARQEFLKSLREPMVCADAFTEGEEVTIMPPIKTSKTGITVSLL